MGIDETEDEENNIFIGRRVCTGVVNITSVVIQHDFFLNFEAEILTKDNSLADKIIVDKYSGWRRSIY